MTSNAFDKIISNNYKRLFQLAYRMVRNTQEAEDIVQDVFLKLWNMKIRLDDYQSVEALAVTMTRNFCIDMLRKRKRTTGDNEMNGQILATDNYSISPYDQYINNEDVRLVAEIIKRLPGTMKEIMEMHEIQGLTYEEMSEINNMNVNTLRVTVSRARKMIKEQYLILSNERGRDQETN